MKGEPDGLVRTHETWNWWRPRVTRSIRGQVMARKSNCFFCLILRRQERATMSVSKGEESDLMALGASAFCDMTEQTQLLHADGPFSSGSGHGFGMIQWCSLNVHCSVDHIGATWWPQTTCRHEIWLNIGCLDTFPKFQIWQFTHNHGFSKPLKIAFFGGDCGRKLSR